MKKNNPHTPILIREAMGVEPKVWARYEYGREKMEPLMGMSRRLHIIDKHTDGTCRIGRQGRRGQSHRASKDTYNSSIVIASIALYNTPFTISSSLPDGSAGALLVS